MSERATTKGPRPAKLRTEVRHLMCRLTPDEQRERGVAMAEARKLLSEQELEKKRASDAMKLTSARIEALAEAVRNCQEERPVTCTLEPDFAADTMTIRRTDNQEVVCIRQLTHEERQQKLSGMDDDEGEGPDTSEVEASLDDKEREILGKEPADIRIETLEYMQEHPKVSCCQALATVKRKWSAYPTGQE